MIAYGIAISVYGVLKLLLAYCLPRKDIEQNEQSFAEFDNRPRVSSQNDEGTQKNTDANHNQVLIRKDNRRSDSKESEMEEKPIHEKSDDTSTNKNSKEKYKDNQKESKEYKVSSYVKLRFLLL